MCEKSEWPWLSWVLAAAAVVIYPSPLLQQWLEYDRQSILAGQVWRVATCHWTHWSFEHLVWDVSMFVLLAAACERWSRRATAVTVLASTIVIPITLAFVQPGMVSYRGLSGLDSAVFLLIAVRIILIAIENRKWVYIVPAAALLTGFAGKLAYESLVGTAIFVQTGGFTPVPLAHAVGAAIGLVVGLFFYARGRRRQQVPETAVVT